MPSTRNDLQRSLYQVLTHNRDGSHNTQRARQHILYQAAKDLIQGGFKVHHVQGFKQKHVRFLNGLWKTQGLAIATIKNRNAHLRWLCEKLNKADMVPSNDALAIGKRCYLQSRNKALELHQIDFSKITQRSIWVSLHLQRHFGLRREESIKIRPHQADRGDHIHLEASWCKGGRERNVPIHHAEARYWLEEAKKLAGTQEQSLIPPKKTYIQQRHQYDRQTQAATIKHPHGLRHAYAQERYEQLTGWKCPKAGGPSKSDLTQAQKRKDRQARLIISEELGHRREAITVNYLGR